ncbi:MAG: 16S rRNA (cytidine(1402)-2'-O)-methyltransferase [Bacteroidales bacterium]
MSGKLYIVPTPIGNLEDITIRAQKTLSLVDLILAEDTRKTSILLKHYAINNKMVSFHLHNEHQSINQIVEKLLSGLNIALVSDAGTPSISDPGFLIVRECIKNDIDVETLPGAVAFVPALVNSGLPSDRFCFEGFLPQKKGRLKRIQQLAEENRTMIFYESPHRITKALEQFAGVFGEDRVASVSRELTKIYEENIRGTLSELIAYFNSKVLKGEFVIVINGKN